LAATPRDHPDFMATFSLVHSADMVFRIMEEVKAREDEYDAVKAIAEQIAGLQQAEKLARRERRLLHQGQLAQTEGAPLYLFVFTDVLLATTADEDEDHRWMLNERAGVCRLLEVLEPSLGKVASLRSAIQRLRISSDTFLCYVSPMTLEDVEDGIISPVSSVVELALHVPAGPLRSAWAAALRACALHTVRSLSFPTHSGRYLAHGPSVDLAADTASSVRALLAAGLPLPKSPSIQIDDAVRGRRAPEHAAEREERGWWALRFQQVLREMQRRPGEL
jgi:serine/arginine repetitive matrix protein 2